MTGFEPVSRDEYYAMVAAGMPEKKLQADIVRLARAYRWIVYHTRISQGSTPGFPDLVMVRGEKVLWRELKTQKRGRVTDPQQAWLDALAGAGQDVGIWRPMDLLDGTVEHELRGIES